MTLITPQKMRWQLVVLASLLTSIFLGRVSGQSQERGMSRSVAPDVAPKYRKMWAVIVGINYDSLTGSAKTEVPTLATAENDARSVSELLISNYDYQAENIRLLTGADATRENIRKAFGDSFLGNTDQVKESDSVLFFFAGHGNRREAQDTHEHHVGLLYPSDVQFVPGRGVDTISCLRIDELLGYMRDYCPARHKLVVLDSCHSGEVFKTHRSSGVNRGFSSDLFLQPAFQAIAAARGNQTAADSDETGKHSPVTRALLDALEHGPGNADRKLFTASELFSYIPDRVSQMPGIKQNPRGGWIDGDGDFYFLPKNLTPNDIPAKQLAAWRSSDPTGRTDSGPQAGSGFFRMLPWLIVPFVGGLVTTVILLSRRKKARNKVDEATVPFDPNAPRLGLRLMGTGIWYQAPTDHEIIRVGRQRRKPGESRQSGNDLVIRANDGDDRTLKISRQHFELKAERGAFSIIDKSSSGTLLNGVKLEPGKPFPIKNSDIISVAEVIQLEVCISSSTMAGKRSQSIAFESQSATPVPLVMEASIGDLVTDD